MFSSRLFTVVSFLRIINRMTLYPLHVKEHLFKFTEHLFRTFCRGSVCLATDWTLRTRSPLLIYHLDSHNLIELISPTVIGSVNWKPFPCNPINFWYWLGPICRHTLAPFPNTTDYYWQLVLSAISPLNVYCVIQTIALERTIFPIIMEYNQLSLVPCGLEILEPFTHTIIC